MKHARSRIGSVSTSKVDASLQTRSRVAGTVIGILFLIIVVRLFYWQILKAAELQSAANDQYQSSVTTQGKRGSLLFHDGSALVTNTSAYRLFVEPQHLSQSPKEITDTLLPILLEDSQATGSAKELEEADLTAHLLSQLSKSDARWVKLQEKISQDQYEKITSLEIAGIGFDPYDIRSYPEASMAAHLTGFVGKTDDGQDIGYFGLEGALEHELKARNRTLTILTDALGYQLTAFDQQTIPKIDGRTITTTLRRPMQMIAEEELKKSLEKYQAESGEVVILNPKTGEVLALATLPSYDQARFHEFSPDIYRNPSLSEVYEPGSTFKVLTVAAGIDAGVISPDTECTTCAQPRVFGQYTIRNWNDVYNPNISMKDALAKSDNTAMIFITDLLGADAFTKYLHAFGIGDPLHIDLQGDTATPFPETWRPVELATRSFGQGISINSMQLVRAIAAIANNGTMMRPYIVEKVEDPVTGEELHTEPVVESQAVSAATARLVTEMMVHAAKSGEAQWAYASDFPTAAKTGTSQIAQEGEYHEEDTIASFVGFAPPEDPQFVMLVKLVRPQSSPWASETAAPTWYAISRKLHYLLGIKPKDI